MIASYQDALTFLYENLPMFQRVGAVAYKKDLTNTIALCHELGNPHLRFKSVHVGGTNGKGSTCHMLASILQTAGYKTGLYTSPHLKEFTERIRVDGEEVSKDFVVDFVNRIRPFIERIKPSFFEITVAMAFDYFAQQEVDMAVIEVGLGGRLDSTNVITPRVSVITNISWDHKDLLGETLEQIATEKAGIIKPGVPVVISQRQQSVEHVFLAKAATERSEIVFASDRYSATIDHSGLRVHRDGTEVLSRVSFPLRGLYQKQNIPGVMETIDILRRDLTISPGDVAEGFEKVVERSGLKGRWQVLQNSPTVVCDTGHNVAGIQEVMQQIALESFDNLFIVWGMVKDKDADEILRLLPATAMYYFCQAKIPRAMEAVVLAQKASAFGLKGEVVPDVNEAKRRALEQARADDLIFIGGSTFVVAELDEL